MILLNFMTPIRIFNNLPYAISNRVYKILDLNTIITNNF